MGRYNENFLEILRRYHDITPNVDWWIQGTNEMGQWTNNWSGMHLGN